MSMFNIFLNSYKQPENKLTFNFLCLLEHMPRQNSLLEYLLLGDYTLPELPIQNLESVFGGYESNPDGLIEIKDINKRNISIYFENKTHRLGLTSQQIKNHIDLFCKESNSKLLVITPRKNDVNIINNLDQNYKEKIYFHTWHDVVKKLNEITNQDRNFIIDQFIEYGKQSGEFEDMTLTTDDINSFVHYYNSNPDTKILYTIESAIKKTDLEKYKKNISCDAKNNRWGRRGYEFSFDNDYGMWFSFGIYYNKNDHGINFKKENIPELAFFLDINPKKREIIKQTRNFDEKIRGLIKIGFEENIINKLTSNTWRFICHRTPLCDVQDFTENGLKERLQFILDNIFTVNEYEEKLLS